jgi:hypothetical protein
MGTWRKRCSMHLNMDGYSGTWQHFALRFDRPYWRRLVSFLDVVTDSTKWSPSWEGNRRLAGEGISRLLWNIKSVYCVRHRSLSWARWIQSAPSYPTFLLSPYTLYFHLQIISWSWAFLLSTIHFNIIHPPTSTSSYWSLSFWLSHQNPICIPRNPHSCYMPRPSHLALFDHSNYTWRRAQVMTLLHVCLPSGAFLYISTRSSLPCMPKE